MITLRALEPEDLELLYSIENEPDLWNLGTPGAPYSRYALKQYLAQQPSDLFQTGQLRLVACADNRAVGLADLLNYSPTDRRAEIGIAMLRAERGKGYGKATLKALEAHARDLLGLRLLYALVPHLRNKASASLFSSCGFTQTALLPQWHFCSGHYEDIAVFQKIITEQN